jgi:hypothetical protein
MALSTAQGFDNHAGTLNTQGAEGGPLELAHQTFFVGINNPFGGNPFGIPFTPVIFELFQSWSNSHGHQENTYVSMRSTRLVMSSYWRAGPTKAFTSRIKRFSVSSALSEGAV